MLNRLKLIWEWVKNACVIKEVIKDEKSENKAE